ncbi:MAG: ATP-grasp domain-containing protein [Pseudomonadota bacterium]|nr:ATP-grasp domain-containing protein [Pseudomonadota bacterium]
MAARPTLLCAAFSARQIAESAGRAGYDALAVDFFADDDLKRAAKRSALVTGHYPDGFSADQLIAALEELAQGETPVGFVYGAGIEDRPELLDRIGQAWPVLGTGAAALASLKTPERFAALCAAADIAHPDITREAPADPKGWLSKQAGGAGGSHVRHADAGPPEPNRYCQRFVEGQRWSALIVAAHGSAEVIGYSRQWCDPSRDEPFRYGGAVGPLTPPDETAFQAAIERLVAVIEADGIDLKGIASLDFIWAPDGLYCLEINPRFGATVDVFDRPDAPLLTLHLDACEGRLPAARPRFAGVRASGLAWADRRLRTPERFSWPDWTADRTAPPTSFEAGTPIATILAESESESAAVALFHERSLQLKQSLEGEPLSLDANSSGGADAKTAALAGLL